MRNIFLGLICLIINLPMGMSANTGYHPNYQSYRECCHRIREFEHRDKLHFTNGQFKILQLTDLHWTPNSPKCAITEATIQSVLNQEKPDLTILTGDVVTEKPALKGWNAIVKIFNDNKQKFVVTLGNHDGEAMAKDSIYQILLKSPYYVGEVGPKNIYGYGNCDIPIYGDNNKVATVLYCFDSNDYLPTNKFGEYDWIHDNQIQWYRQVSEKYTKENAGKPIPSYAFFHIPLLEMNKVAEDTKTYGYEIELPVSSPKINSGLFGAFIDKKDVAGVFVGHDHDNDYIGLHYGIGMGFGRVTGADAYGKLVRGGRIIELYEGQKKFNTWIRTPQGKEATYYYPSGITSKQEAEMPYLQAQNVEPKLPGISYIYREGKCKKANQIENCKIVQKGALSNFSIKDAPAKDHFQYEFYGYIYISKKGIYKFYTFSDDGSMLYIDNHLVIDNDGGHSPRRKDGIIGLDKGYHKIKLLYFEDYMGQYLEVGYSGKDIFETRIPNKILFQDPEKLKEPKVLYKAFAHNDENQKSPLNLALSCGFNNVEVDAYYINGHFYVAHERPQNLADSTQLMEKYFYPLFNRIKENGGSVYKNSKKPFYLMIDIKQDGEAFYKGLKPFLIKHKNMFCSYKDGKVVPGPILLFFSGSRPMNTITKENTRYAFIDGKFNELGKSIKSSLCPIVSDDYKAYFKWTGKGQMPKNEKDILKELLEKAHKEDKMLRLWGAPDTISVMRMQIKEGVDIIGTDSIKTLSNLLNNK